MPITPLPSRHLITAALPYANGPLHIGHLAGAYLSSDIYARYLRLMGRDVVFVCGSDEHGAAITIRAKTEGLTPQAIVDKYHEQIRATFERLGVSFDVYHRTSAPLHHELAQEFFLDLEAKGNFSVETSEQYYDEQYSMFLADRYIIGTCPHCANEKAYGDQCERCGNALTPLELIEPRSMMSGLPPVLRETKHWYFLQNRYADFLREWVERGTIDGVPHHDTAAWKNHVLGQCRSWLDFGELRPRPITRDLDWGIPVPLEEAAGKVLYVWFDAPIGYISATKALGIERTGDPEWWRQYWQSPDTELVHFIGKDNIVFHCIIFPAMLRAHGDFVLPTNVPANQFLNLEGEKLSTSRNWAVWAHEYLDDFATQPHAADVLRYTLTRNMPEQRDTEFTWAGFRDNNDADLVGTFANSLNRVISLLNKYYDGTIPPYNGNEADGGAAICEDVYRNALESVKRIGISIEAFNFRDALSEVLQISRLIDGTLQSHEPWKRYKAEPESVYIKDVLYTCVQCAAVVSVVAAPFMPAAAATLRTVLNLPATANGDWEDVLTRLEKGEPFFAPNHRIGTPQHLFTRIPDELLEVQTRRLANISAELAGVKAAEAAAAAPPPVAQTEATNATHTPVKPATSYDDFAKLDLRTATIVAAERVKKADKLLKLTLDVGFEQRTVVSGIALDFEPEAIVGQQVLLLANLEPRPLRGIVSEGMILMAANSEGKLAFVAPPAGFENGMVVK